MTLLVKAGAVMAAAWLAPVASSHAQVPRPGGGLDNFAARGSATKIGGHDAFVASAADAPAIALMCAARRR
jgi:hypothetical protein